MDRTWLALLEADQPHIDAHQARPQTYIIEVCGETEYLECTATVFSYFHKLSNMRSSSFLGLLIKSEEVSVSFCNNNFCEGGRELNAPVIMTSGVVRWLLGGFSKFC